MEERRKTPRRPVRKSAAIMLSGGRKLVCTMRDVSKAGAGLEVARDASVPGVFKMMVEMESTQRRCRIIWRAETRMGVVFDA